jgi:hypothetical protein
MVVVAVRVATTLVILVVMAPWAGTVVAVSPLLVRSCGGNDATDMQEPDAKEPCVDELCSQ